MNNNIGPDPSKDKFVFDRSECGWIGPIPTSYSEDVELQQIVDRAIEHGSWISVRYMIEHLYLEPDDYVD